MGRRQPPPALWVTAVLSGLATVTAVLAGYSSRPSAGQAAAALAAAALTVASVMASNRPAVLKKLPPRKFAGSPIE